MRMMRGLMMAVALAAAVTGCSEEQSAGQKAMQPWVGVNIGDLSVQTLDGQPQALRDVLLFGGDKRPVVINVWATWCPPCLKEMPTLDALGKTGAVTVVAIATDKDAQVVKEYLRNQTWGSGVQVWHDSLGAVTRQKLGAKGLPVTYVLDKNLTIKMVEAGERDWSHEKMLAKIMAAVK